ESTVVNERETFVLRALEPGANVAELCREAGISRKTGYKWLQRFRERGMEGLHDLSRRPHMSPLRCPGEVVLRIIELRRAHPRWGAKKLHAVLRRGVDAGEVPSVRTIARVLDRAGLVQPRRRRRSAQGPSERPTPDVAGPNDVWTVDFKGWWRTTDGAKAEPLTVRDAWSRYVLEATLMERTTKVDVQLVFLRLFQDHGLPRAIQVDNGAPFACTRSAGGLTRLSAWWVSLGIHLVRGRPAHPQDNGGHERMHLDMRYEVEDVAAGTLSEQREALARWRVEFNEVRPHEALDMKTPAEVYRRSPRPYAGPRTPFYPSAFETRMVNAKGYVKLRGQRYYVSLAVAGRAIGLVEIEPGQLSMRYFDHDLGVLTVAA
ncbi:MAG: IS481 family transposase, partial [Myxococcales bacterium]|nr:IS481 family transposase [Myxococcales bacterium]